MMNKKRGMTLIELIVAITLFTIVVTLAIGGFVAVARMKTLMVDMKDTQQKSRLIYETIYRSAKEADNVAVTSVGVGGSGNALILNYSSPDEQKVFVATTTLGTGQQLNYSDCLIGPHPYYTNGIISNYSDSDGCTTYTTEDLLTGTPTSSYNLLNNGNPYFILGYSIPETLTLNMTIKNISTANDVPIKLDNVIILENVQ